MAPTVVRARAADVDAMARTLGRAFGDDPVFETLLGAPIPPERIERFFGLVVEGNLREGSKHVLRTEDDEGAAMWAPPGTWKTPLGELLRSAPGMVRCFGRRLPIALRVLQATERHHPTEPHWYLAYVGTDPDHQGKGVGRALIQPVVERCDAEGVGAYLESSKERNVPYYRRFGFEVVEEIEAVPGAREWLMWRDPR